MPKTIILIPARMASTRLPGKPLADINGLPMIVQVLRRAEAAHIGEAVVATDSEAVQTAVEKSGGRAVMTRTDHVSGSDRIYEALEALDPEQVHFHEVGGIDAIVAAAPTTKFDPFSCGSRTPQDCHHGAGVTTTCRLRFAASALCAITPSAATTATASTNNFRINETPHYLPSARVPDVREGRPSDP